MLKEFRDFISKGNVMDMAVGIIVGAAFTAIVTSLVADLINPIIGLILGGIDFSSMYVVLKGHVDPGVGLKAARDTGAAIFAYGSFISAIINFLILVWMLKRFLYKPILDAIDEREKGIARQLADAEAKKAEKRSG